MNKLALIAVLALTATVGCAGFNIGGPGGDDQTVLIAGDIGALGCAAFVTQGKPEDVVKGREALKQLRTALASPNPTVAAFGAACSQAPEKYSALCAAVVNRVVARFGEGGPLKKDSKAFEALTAFTEACAVSLG